MPLDTTTIDIAAELERVEERLDELADEQVALEDQIDDATDGDEQAPRELQEEYQQVISEANQLDTDRVALQWARDPDTGIDPVDEIEIAALTAGEMAEVGDRTDAVADLKSQEWGIAPDMNNAEQVHFAAAVLEDAPFIDDGADFEAKLDVFNADGLVRPQFVRWIARKGREESTPDVEGKSYAERVGDRRTTSSATSATPEQS